MSLKITGIENSNKPSEEFVRLKATARVNISNYAVIDNTFDKSGNKTNVYRHFYWFPDLVLEMNDYVRLYTGKGTYRSYENDAKTTTHMLYWGSSECIWNEDGSDQAELLQVKSVSTAKAPRD